MPNGDQNGSPVEVKKAPAKPEISEFVLVTDSTGEVLEIPTNEDNSLNLTTLQAAICGATGLKYKNPKTGANRTVLVDSTGSKLLPPADGWDEKTFQVILNATVIVTSPPVPVQTSRGTDVSVKRRKMDDSDDDEDSESEGRLGRKRAAESSPDRRPVDLLVLGVNYKTTDESFKSYFETFGPVLFAEIKRNPDGARTSKGFGFIQMTNIDDQDKVLKQKDHQLDGRKLEVKLPDPKSHWDTPVGKKQSRDAINKIFVGRLVDKIHDTTLRDFFEKEAKKLDDNAIVTDVFVPNPFRGFGFVTFSNAEIAEKICKPGNYVIENVSCVVRLAVPKDTYPLQSNMNGSPYKNDYGYSYGYGRGGAGYSDYRPNESPRPFNTAWSQQPTTTPLRGSNNRRPGRRSAASPAFSASGIPPPTQPPQPLIPDPQSYSMVPNQIANGIDALNLNHKNPELINAAWNAFYSTLNSTNHQMATMSPHGMSPRPPQNYIPHPQMPHSWHPQQQ